LRLEFTKMQGAGNDFVIIENLGGEFAPAPETIRFLCDRHFGIGADGVLTVEKSESADLRMRVFNADGSEPEMCGNGIRCFARYAREKGLADSDEFEVETLSGIVRPRIRDGLVEVDMGLPRLEGPEIPVNLPGRVIDRPVVLAGREISITCVSMGNPHCVIFPGGGEDFPAAVLGPEIEADPLFPNRTNVEFVRILGRGEIAVEVWERGAGLTLACGTGACAAVVAGHLSGRLDREALVRLPGGDLRVRWDADGRVFLTGPAEFVFQGRISLP